MRKIRKYLAVFMMLCICFTSLMSFAASINIEAAENEVTKAAEQDSVAGDTARSGGSGEVTRIQWLEALTTAFHMYVEERNYPDNYYSDIDAAYENYYTVMLATEFGLVDVEAGSAFDPDAAADREFAAHTLNICTGYVPETKEYTFSEAAAVSYPDDIQVAIDKEWFALSNGSFEPDKTVTVGEKDKLIQIAEEIYAETQIDINHENQFEFQSDVIVLPEGVNVVLTNENEFTITDCNIALKQGDKFAIIVDGFPVVKKVKTVAASGNVQIVATQGVDMADAFKSINIQGSLTGDLAKAQACNDDVELSYIVGGTPEENYQDGVAYASLEEVGNQSITAVYAVQEYEIPENLRIAYDIGDGVKATVTCTLSNVESDYGCNGLDSAFAVINGDVTFTCNVSTDLLKDMGISSNIDLVKVGVADCIYAKATLNLSAKGSVDFSLVEHFGMGVGWSSRNGFHYINDFYKKSFTIYAKAEVGAGVTLSAGFDLGFLTGDISGKIGAKAEVIMDTYDDGHLPETCAQMSAWLYLSIRAEIKLDVWIYKKSWNETLDIYNRSNSPIRVSFHYEDGVPVDRCTRDGSTAAGGSGSTGGASTGTKVKYYTPINSRYGYSGASKGTDSAGKPYTLFEYSLDGINATITKYNGNVASLAIPSQLDGYTVVGIANNVFQNRTELRSVVIPDSVTSIGSSAFGGCTNLASVILSKSVTTIGAHAFQNCDALTGIEIPKSLEKTETGSWGYASNSGIFDECNNLKNIRFEAGTIRVAQYLFANCPGLERIELPAGITSIDDGAFYNCRNLREVVTPNTVTVVEFNAFEKCISLSGITLPDSITEIGGSAFRDCTALSAVVIPDSVTTIREYAFSGCTSLASVILSKAVTTIGAQAFRNCDALTSIEIPKSLEKTEIINTLGSSGIFSECDNLKNIRFEAGTTRVAQYLFANCPGLERIELPGGITSIDYGAFYNCRNLREVVLPNTVTVIKYDAFYNCIALSEIVLPDSITEIGGSAFRDCTALSAVAIPDSVTTIGEYAFSGCTNLASVILSKAVTTIGAHTFQNCDALTGIEIPKSLEKTETGSWGYASNSGIFDECNNLKNIRFEAGTIRVAQYLFANCPGLERIELPAGITSIDDGAFYNCRNLREVVTPNTVTVVEFNAFEKCISLSGITLPDSITEIGGSAFRDCTALSSIVLPNSVTSIGSSVFSGCSSLQTAVLPQTITNVTGYMFQDCTALTRIILPDTVTAVSSNAFKNCTSLAEVVMGPKVERIGEYAFYNCDALTSVDIPDSVTRLDSYCFSDCELLSKVRFGSGLETVPSYAFNLCPSLTAVMLPHNLTTVKNNAFSNCTALTEVTIPKKVTAIESNAFSYPNKMTVYGVSDSYAQTWAADNGAKFVSRNVPASSVSLNTSELQINRNNSVSLFAHIEPENFTDDVTWKSSDTSVATVSDKGVVKAVGMGTATIRVFVGNVSASCTVMVLQPVTGLSISSRSMSMEAGESKTLTVSVSPSNAGNKSVIWSSSDETVAIVDQAGKVTAVGKGTAVITAAAADGSEKTASCNVTVTGTVYVCTETAQLESPHNYKVNCADSWLYTVKDAKQLTLTFDRATAFEDGFDYLYLYDGDGRQIGKYTGSALAGQSVTVSGDTVRIKLVSDGSGTAWGFKVTKVSSTNTVHTTVYNGIDYSAIYDYDYYISRAENADVKNAFGDNDAAVLEHFVNSGMSEGRIASAEFDVSVYKANNQDLRKAYGDDTRAYYMHYINYGQYEKENDPKRNAAVGTLITAPEKPKGVTIYNGVDYSAVYDYDYYISRAENSDVKNAFGDNDAAVLEHFVNNGMNEGRIASAQFDVSVYKANNQDVRNAFGNDMRAYYTHYMNYGQYEKENDPKRNAAVGTPIITPEKPAGVTVYNGVDYSAVYDYSYYISRAENSDVKNAFGDNDAVVLEHFVNNGMNEGRIASAEFDVNVYKANNEDLRRAFGDDTRSYYTHYMNYGQHEKANDPRRNAAVGTPITAPDTPKTGVTVHNGVDYSAVYDYSYYISLESNSDVKNALGENDAAVLEHFVNYGMSEGRLASAEFDVNVYKANNEDLRRAFGDDTRSYYLHYINYGKNEKANDPRRNAEVGTPIATPEPSTSTAIYNGIDYSAVYDKDYYLSHYGDLQAAFGDNAEALIKHFVEYGMSEGRVAKAGFNVNVYKANNMDLQAAFGDDTAAYYRHYMEYGKNELHRVVS